MSNYKELVNAVANGTRFNINFETRTARVGKKYIVKNGVIATPLELEKETPEETVKTIQSLYRDYKYSVPSERSETRRRQYFKALEEKDLPDEALLYGIPREVARFRLEMYILSSILDGSLSWDNGIMKGWFWKSEEDKDLIIFKKWISLIQKQ